MVSERLELTAPETALRPRKRRDPRPRFKPDRSRQLDAVMGCPALAVPANHLARRVFELVSKLDTATLEGQYSSLGRRGYHPRQVLAVWVYASLVGMHESTKVHRASRTDHAFRFLSGGHDISSATLRRFRFRNAEFFRDAIQQTVELAKKQGLLDVADCAVDSMRLRAHAAVSATRTLERSRRRLEELAAERGTVPEEKHAVIDEKIAKHEKAVAQCEASDRTSVVLTNPSAALMKFPSGASAPGHRVTVSVAGQSARIVLAVLVDASTTDYGKLEPITAATRDVLQRAGVDTRAFQVAADGGYTALADLQFAASSRDWVDVLVPVGDLRERASKFFGRDRFTILDDGIVCPADKRMAGPYPDTDGRLKWEGVGCASCPMRPQCTSSKRARAFTLHPKLEQSRGAMQHRMAQPDAAERYNRRIATVEPVFSSIESTMGFRRASSRHAKAVVAEVLLKVLAHNLSRLAVAKPLRLVYCVLSEF